MKGALKKEILNLARQAKAAASLTANLTEQTRNKALFLMADALTKKRRYILNENKKDLTGARTRGLSPAFIDRLSLNEQRIDKMSRSLKALAGLADPLTKAPLKRWRTTGGLVINKVRVPIGVVAIIYESRPDVTSDCAGICLKSGNCVILRGGSEAFNSNRAILKVLKQAIRSLPIPAAAISLIPGVDRQAVKVLLGLSDYIDLVIPRGGQALISQVSRLARMPVIKHYKGICHVYVDEYANLDMAEKICFNAKVQRPGVCNAMETMLVHKRIAQRFLPAMIKQFRQAQVEIRGCPLTRRIAQNEKVIKATEEDFRREYLDLKLSVKVVNGISEAVNHINFYGSRHSDSIITANRRAAEYFLKHVDSACVYHNASTRFTDGYQFGMGAEVGISTDKIHARGPMALEELTTYKYAVLGNGQIRTV